MKKTLFKKAISLLIAMLMILSIGGVFAEVTNTYTPLNESGETKILGTSLSQEDRTSSDGVVSAKEGAAISFKYNGELTFKVANQNKGTYDLFVGAYNSTAARNYTITVDDGEAQSVTIYGKGQNEYVDTSLKLTLEAGNHIIKVKSAVAQHYFYGISLIASEEDDEVEEEEPEEPEYTYVELDENGETVIMAKDLAEIDKTQADGSVLRNEGGAVVFATNSELCFRVSNKEKGFYELFFEFGASSKSYDITIDDGEVQTVSFEGAGKGNYASALKLTFDAGNHTIKIKNKSGMQFYFYGIKLAVCEEDAEEEEPQYSYPALNENGETRFLAKDLDAADRTSSGGIVSAKEGAAVSFKMEGELTFRVSNKEKGLYELSLGAYNAAAAKNYDIMVDGGAAQSVSITGKGPDEYVPVLNLTLDEGNHTIIVKSTVGQHYFYGIELNVLTKVMVLESASANGYSLAESKQNSVPSGIDCIDFSFSELLDADSVSAKTVSLTYEENGETKNVAADFYAEEKVLKVAIKEALKQSCSYKVTINGVKDKYGLTTVLDKEFTFDTTTADVKNGEISATAVLDYGNAKITGKYISSAGVGVAGRNIKFYLSEIGQTADGSDVTDENGNFEIDYVFADNKQSGVYTFIIDGDFVIKTCNIDVMYITRAKEKELIDSIDAMTKGTEVEKFLEDYGTIMGIDLEKDLVNVPNPAPVYENMLNKPYQDAEELREEFYTQIALETINQATEKEVADIILSNEKDCDLLGLDYDRIHLIEDNYDAFLADVISLSNADDKDELKEMIYPVIEKWAAIEYGFSDLTIDEDNKTVYAGQGVEISLEFAEEAQYFKGAKLDITASDDSMLEYISKDAEKNVSLKDNKKDDTLYIEAKYEGKNAVLKLGTVTLTAPQKAGTYTVTIKGIATFENEDGIVFNTNIKEITLDINVKAKENQGSGGGSRPTSSSSGRDITSDSMSASEYKEQIEAEKEEIKNEQYKFTDLENVSWAEESIYALLDKKVISESDDNKFYPTRNITREEFVKMLVLALGFTGTNETSSFADVDENAWYYPYVVIAEKNGLVAGNENNEFGVGEYITRQDMSTIVARALGKLDYVASGDGEKFADDDDISEYAKKYVYAMRNEGIINGVGDNCFAPKNNADRAQAAKIIYSVLLAAKQ